MERAGIVILGNMTKPGVEDQIDSLRSWFAERAKVLGVYSHENCPADVAGRAKLCVVFGGDGTLLSAGRDLAPLGVPLLGVNMGKLGFLADFNVEHLQRHFDDALAGRIQPSERMMLSVSVEGCHGRGEGACGPMLVANDVAISAGHPFRMIDLEVRQGGQCVARYLGDGLVMSTPTGSTGYNMSAGGPILQPTLQAVAITPIAPHTLSLRPIVVGPSPAIDIRAERVNAGTQMIVDGQVPHDLLEGQVLHVSRADCSLRILPHPGRAYFDTLAGKLQWGQSPHHNAARPRKD